MPSIRIIQNDKATTVEAHEGSNLWKVLNSHGFELYSPCGGRGVCGKCKVHVKGLGSVLACRHAVNEEMEVVLPGLRETFVLADQHKYTIKLAPDAGPGIKLSDRPHGIAIDLGTSTLALQLANLSNGTYLTTRTATNPQTRYGADVISRIHYASQTPGGPQELQRTLIYEINQQIRELLRFHGLEPGDLVRFSITGNPTMMHILLGIDPLPLALVPFEMAFSGWQTRIGSQLGFLLP
jgi:uncharacterized 2Fe-2S/4Fe-4S cluster protein (DUF4445 family)